MDRSSKRRQVKPLAASLLEALDYDSSDDSDFKVGEDSGTEGTGNESGDASKESGEGSSSDSDENALEEELETIAADEEEEETEPFQAEPSKISGSDSGMEREKAINKEEKDTSDEEKPKMTNENEAEVDNSMEEQNDEPRKWNLRKNRPLLDFISIEDLNEIEDYDSEEDNDWRPTAVRKKGRATSQKVRGDAEGDDEDDDGSGSEEENEDDENDENDSSDSEAERKIKKRKIFSRQSVDEEELTNDSLALSQSKSNEDSLILEKTGKWNSQKLDHILMCSVCLGDNSEDADEIIQCDNCGITVHEDALMIFLA